MNDSEFFDLSHDSGVAHLRLNRPERLNTMTPAFFPAIRDAVRRLGEDGGTRALVLSSTGKHFSAGMALEVFAGGDALLVTASARQRLAFQESLRKLMDCFSALDEARFPVIAAVQGGCIGGGVDLATACCLRYAVRDAWFVIQEINLGMMADVGTFNRMPKQLPEAVVRELGYTGDKLPAERAERLGFVNGLFDTHEQLVAGALQVAKRIASKAPVAVAATKQMISYTRDHSVAESFGYLNALQPAIFDLEEIKRRLAARP